MAVPIINFIDITSGVGGAAVVPTRNLGAMIITGNPLVPTGNILTFQSATDVAEYFGTESEEYARAVFYFSWISKEITRPSLLSFWRWVNTSSSASIYGKPANYSLSDFTSISSGGFHLTMGGHTFDVAGIDLSGAANLTEVADDIQTAIRAESGGGSDWTSATVTYDPVRKSFNLVSGVSGAGSQASGFVTLDSNPSPGVRSSGTITLDTNPAALDTLTVNGTLITFVASGATGNQVNIGADEDATAAALQIFLAASIDVNISKATYDTTTNETTVTFKNVGTSGNAFTLAKSSTHISLSGANLTGGVAADTLTINGTLITFVDTSPTGNQVFVGVSVDDTSANLQTFLSGSSNSNIVLATYSTLSDTTTITYRQIGTSGNSFTLAKSSASISLSGANLTGGSVIGDISISAAVSGTDLAGPLGWLTGALLSNGVNTQTIPDSMNQLVSISNNFGSFCFTTALNLSLDEVEDAANWNNSISPNIQFIYSIPVSSANAASWSDALIDIGGCTLTLSPFSGEYPEMVPMNILAATDYNAVNAVQNYMYQSNFNLTVSVTTQADYNLYTGLRVNFYGNTQTAGQTINFYMKGFMMGGSNVPQFQNLYANEIWFKDALAASLLSLLLALSEVPANNAGRSQILATMQSIISQALNNGVIEAGKALNTTQKLFITQLTGSPNAWQQVQNIGYWVNVVITSSIVDSVTIYTATYTLIYSKNDVILKITGSDVLI